MRKVRLISFGYSKGQLPVGAADAFDCRGIHNPHNQAHLRRLDGRHMAVKEYVMSDPRAAELFGRALNRAMHSNTIAFGCFGGRHRSVAMVEMMADRLRDERIEVEIKHREL